MSLTDDYVRVPLMEYRELRSRLAAMERGGVCIWCGEAIDLTGKDMESAVDWARAHDESCERNPLRSRLAEAEALLREARKQLGWYWAQCLYDGYSPLEDRLSVNMKDIDAFLTPDSASHRENERE